MPEDVHPNDTVEDGRVLPGVRSEGEEGFLPRGGSEGFDLGGEKKGREGRAYL